MLLHFGQLEAYQEVLLSSGLDPEAAEEVTNKHYVNPKTFTAIDPLGVQKFKGLFKPGCNPYEALGILNELRLIEATQPRDPINRGLPPLPNLDQMRAAFKRPVIIYSSRMSRN